MADQEHNIQNNANIISVPSIKLPYNEGIGSIIFKKMSENKDSIGQIDAITGEKDTFGAMLQRSVRTAITMRSKGITSDDIVTICSYNHLDTNIPIIASFLLGVKTASTDPAFSLTDTVFLLNQVKPKMIFVSSNAVQLIEEALKQITIQTEIVVFGNSKKHTTFSDFLKQSPEETIFRPVEVKDVKETAVIFFSSGTSGLSKGICLSHLCLLAQVPCTEYGLASIVFFSYSTPCWISSLVFLINCTIQNHCRLIAPQFDSDVVYSLINTYQVQILYLVSSQFIELVSRGLPKGADTSSLLALVSGGASLSKEQVSEARRMFPTAFVGMGYGLTEFGGMVIGFSIAADSEDPQLLFEKPTSSGRPQQGRSYKIVDPETEKILGVNQQGELRIKTEYQMNGYFNLDSSKEWDFDGFLKTGDIAYYDEDYCFYIVDRIKEMLKYKNYHISPAKLEGILMNHPAVESAVVVGLPHPLDGDHPLGIVVLKKSAASSDVTAEEIKNYFNDRIDDDKQKLRGGVIIVDDLPKTPTGKFSRRHARNLALKQKL